MGESGRIRRIRDRIRGGMSAANGGGIGGGGGGGGGGKAAVPPEEDVAALARPDEVEEEADEDKEAPPAVPPPRAAAASSNGGGGSTSTGSTPSSTPSSSSVLPPPRLEPHVEPVGGIVQPPVTAPPNRPGRVTNQLQYLKNTVIKGRGTHTHTQKKNIYPTNVASVHFGDRVVPTPEQILKSSE